MRVATLAADTSGWLFKTMKNRKICPTELWMCPTKIIKQSRIDCLCPTDLDVPDTIENETQDISDWSRCVDKMTKRSVSFLNGC